MPDEDIKYHEPPKKQRIAHSQKKLASQTSEQLPNGDSSSMHVTAASSQNLKTKAEKKCMYLFFALLCHLPYH